MSAGHAHLGSRSIHPLQHVEEAPDYGHVALRQVVLGFRLVLGGLDGHELRDGFLITSNGRDGPAYNARTGTRYMLFSRVSYLD